MISGILGLYLVLGSGFWLLVAGCWTQNQVPSAQYPVHLFKRNFNSVFFVKFYVYLFNQRHSPGVGMEIGSGCGIPDFQPVQIYPGGQI